jgi:hypothetical protein
MTDTQFVPDWAKGHHLVSDIPRTLPQRRSCQRPYCGQPRRRVAPRPYFSLASPPVDGPTGIASNPMSDKTAAISGSTSSGGATAATCRASSINSTTWSISASRPSTSTPSSTPPRTTNTTAPPTTTLTPTSAPTPRATGGSSPPRTPSTHDLVVDGRRPPGAAPHRRGPPPRPANHLRRCLEPHGPQQFCLSGRRRPAARLHLPRLVQDRQLG